MQFLVSLIIIESSKCDVCITCYWKVLKCGVGIRVGVGTL